MSIRSAIIKRIQSIPMPAWANKAKIKLEKNAPDIMVVVGAAIVVGSAIYACTKTMEAHDILEEANEELEDIKYGLESADGNPEFDEKAARKERMKVYGRMATGLGRCYGPAIIGGATGLGLMLGAHKILKDRNTAITMAYANLLASYNSYRASVREELGEEREFMLRTGSKLQEIESVDENGEVTTQNAMVVHDDGSMHSIYARIFDEANINWSRKPSDNLTFIKSQQCFANDKLRAEGFLFLNDVYQMLGFPRTSEGQIVGWIWDPNDEIDDGGDNLVDFGIFSNAFQKAEIRDFINGYEPCIWLDFNVDGVIYDLF